MMGLLENIFIPTYMKKIYINNHFCIVSVFKIYSNKQVGEIGFPSSLGPQIDDCTDQQKKILFIMNV